MSDLKGIFFDAHGVLYDREQPTAEYTEALLVSSGYAALLTPVDAVQARELRDRATEGRITHEAYWDQVLKWRGVAAPAARSEFTRRILEQTRDVYGYPGTRDALLGLKQRGFRLGIITDTMYPLSWKMEWLRQAGVADLIEVIACSSELGVHKPDPAIYLNAMQQAGLTPAESGFVGHDARELRGATHAGMTTVAVHYDPDAVAQYYAGSLLGLLDVPVFQRAKE